MKKRLVAAIVLIVLSGTIFFIFIDYQYKQKSITEIAKLNNNGITKIVLIDGRDANKFSTIEDKQKINEFMKLVDSDIIRKEKKHQYSNGWKNYIDFYSNKKKLKTITLTNDLEVEGKYYEIIKGELTQNKIIELMTATTYKN